MTVTVLSPPGAGNTGLDLDTLKELIANLPDLDRTTIASQFPRLTLVDSVAVMLQHPTATDVRTYVAWLRAGRRVRHGEHGIVLPQRVDAIKRARVFDVDQTSLELDLPQPTAVRPAEVPIPEPTPTARIQGAPCQPCQLATSRYAGFQPEWGVPVRITVGYPRGFRLPFELALALAPYELFRPPYKGIDNIPVETLVYNRRLEAHGAEAYTQLCGIAARNPGRRLVLLCFENVVAGEACHRRWAAEWMAVRWGWNVPEINPASPT